MKYIKIILGLLFSINCLSQNEYHVEDILYDCLIEKFDSADIDIIKELDDYETYLVKNKILNGTSGQDYYDYYVSIQNSNNISANIKSEMFYRLNKVPISEFYVSNCIEELNQVDSSIILLSIFYKLHMTINKKDFASTLPRQIKQILTVLNPSALENEYYRTLTLLLIAFIADFEDSKIVLPPIEETEENN